MRVQRKLPSSSWPRPDSTVDAPEVYGDHESGAPGWGPVSSGLGTRLGPVAAAGGNRTSSAASRYAPSTVRVPFEATRKTYSTAVTVSALSNASLTVNGSSLGRSSWFGSCSRVTLPSAWCRRTSSVKSVLLVVKALNR